MPAPVVVVFPGQGAQKRGMAQDFAETWPEAAAVFDQCSEALGEDLRALCWGDDPRLELTTWTQPAILTAEVAMFRALEAHHGFAPTHLGGHSLGEYTALVCAGVIPLEDAVVLVHHRGRLMQQAVPEGEGAMAAVIGSELDLAVLEAACAGLAVDLANHNSPDQVVISGAADDVVEAVARLDLGEGPRLRVRPLPVSAPFHSRLMAPVEPEFRELLEESLPRWRPEPAARVVSNLSGGLHEPSAEAVRDALTGQISGAVRWVDCMKTLLALEPAATYELGPSRPLRGFFRALGHDVTAITNTKTVRRAFG